MLKAVVAGVLMLGSVGLVGTASAEVAPQPDYAVVGGTLSVRSGPSNSDQEFFKLEPGAQVMLLEWGGDWKRISDSQGREGWVQSTFGASQPLTLEPLTPDQVVELELASEEAPEAQASTDTPMRTVSSTGVTVRLGPGKSNSALFALPAGSKVTVLSESKGWLQIRDSKGRTGWAYSDYVGG